MVHIAEFDCQGKKSMNKVRTTAIAGGLMSPKKAFLPAPHDIYIPIQDVISSFSLLTPFVEYQAHTSASLYKTRSAYSM